MKTNHFQRTRQHENVNRGELMQGRINLELKKHRTTDPMIRNTIEINLNKIQLLLKK
jgi:hypothetical protein